ncbi:MAG: hypothetical protein C0631_11055 [Sedimenticola sp.]|nr:MAG: hypothetical protein C0631_11055 [Sedimenticola sp.]
MTKSILLITTLLLSSLLMPGCQTLEKRDFQVSLDSALAAYAAAMRWGHPAQAYSFLDPSLEQNTANQEALNNIRVTNYKVFQQPAQTAEDKAQQSVAIQYVLVDEQVEKTLIDNQVWKYEKETQKWTRFNAIPVFE